MRTRIALAAVLRVGAVVALGACVGDKARSAAGGDRGRGFRILRPTHRSDARWRLSPGVCGVLLTALVAAIAAEALMLATKDGAEPGA